MKNKIGMAALIFAALVGSVVVAEAQDYGRYDRDRGYDSDDYRYDNGYYNRSYGYGRENFGYGMRVARDFGFRDGAQVAREDMLRGKPFNPNPRGRYDDADRGYQRRFGNKHEYRERYTDAYRSAYQNTYRGNRYGNGYGYYNR